MGFVRKFNWGLLNRLKMLPLSPLRFSTIGNLILRIFEILKFSRFFALPHGHGMANAMALAMARAWPGHGQGHGQSHGQGHFQGRGQGRGRAGRTDGWAGCAREAMYVGPGCQVMCGIGTNPAWLGIFAQRTRLQPEHTDK